MGKSPYTEEFKLEAVRLVREKKQSIAATARNLGVSKDTLQAWLKQPTEAKGESKPSDLLEENAKLRRELKIAQDERDILKKAVAYFAKESH